MVHREILDLNKDGLKEVFFCAKCDAPVAANIGSCEVFCDDCIKEERHDVSVHFKKIDDEHFRYFYNMNENNLQMSAIAYFSGFMFACKKMGMKIWDILRWSYKLSFSMSEMENELKEEHAPLFNSIFH